MIALLSLSLALANPHPHTGKLTPFTSAPAAVSLGASDEEKLKNGKPVLKQKVGGEGGEGVAVQYISASSQDVWDTILDYGNYKNWVKNVDSATIYQKKGSDWYVETRSKVALFSFVLYTRNSIHRDQGYMSWTLDYSKKSDLNDSVGYWRVEELSSDPPLTRVDYSTKIIVSGVPDFLAGYLTEDALIEGTKWVKKQAEAK